MSKSPVRQPIPAILRSRLVIFCTLIFSTAFALAPFFPALPKNSTTAERAMQTVLQLSRSSREPGSPGSQAARDYLVDQLRSMGMEVALQPAPTPGADPPTQLHNIIARLPGRQPGQALLLIAHYDSSAASPGAGDNASGVAVVLEIARAAAKQSWRNDLLLLLSDGEELGVFGAPLFVERHPRSPEVHVALNFDTLTYGPVLLWQTGQNNGWLVQQYQRSAPAPMGYSWIDAISRLLPLSTDIEPFLSAGISGGSFTTPYLPPQAHTALDQSHLVTPASLDFTYQQAAPLAFYLLDGDLSAPVAPDRVYFSLWGPWLVSYPADLAAPFALLLLLTTFTVIGLKNQPPLDWMGMFRGIVRTFFSLIVAGLLQLIFELTFTLRMPLASVALKIPLSLVIVASITTWGFYRLRRRHSRQTLYYSAIWFFALLGVWTSIANPLLSPLFTLPWMAGLLPLILNQLVRPFASRRGTAILSLALQILLIVPPIYLLYMVSGLIWIPAVLAAVLLVLGLGLLLPVIDDLLSSPDSQPDFPSVAT